LAHARTGKLGRGAVFVNNRHISQDTWRDAPGKTFQPQVHYFVAGATKMLLDTDCKAHELDNVYVVDTSFLS